MAAVVRKVYKWVAPDAEKEVDGRDKWPSRAAFVLAAMGGAVGLGNLLRYPSVVFANNGVQWFIPYLIALTCLGIPVLMLEISIGQAYRGGVMIATNGINRRLKGVGLGVIMNGYVVATYYVPILSWIMHYFRSSFQSPLPWTGRGDDFYMKDVIANPDPIQGSISGGSVAEYTQYPATGFVNETVGWCAFVWFCVFLCMFKGVGVTGRVVYFTMGLPVVMIFILMGRALSLENASKGVKMYFAEWHGEKLGQGTIWQAACGQIFFSIGVGFGYFTSYASYNSKFANAVQDSLIIALSNSLYEVLAGFAVFGVIGFLGLRPEDGVTLSTFSVGFLTYPLAIVEIPGANFWAVAFFLTIAILGLSSAFALVESMVTMICDTSLGKRVPRATISTVVIIVSFLLSLIYCTEFGFYLLDAVDTWTNNLALIFVVWCECVSTTTLYRAQDVYRQVGFVPFVIHSTSYVLSMVLGVAVGQAVGPEAGAGVGFGIFIIGNVVSVAISKTPDSVPPRFWGKNPWLSKFWWLSFYSPNQLRRDLNLSVATGKNWSIPWFWGPTLRYISAPILAIIVSFAYPDFYKKRMDPLHIFAFAIAHIVMVFIICGLIVPRSLDIFVPPERRYTKPLYAPQVAIPGFKLEGEEIEEQVVVDDVSEKRTKE